MNTLTFVMQNITNKDFCKARGCSITSFGGRNRIQIPNSQYEVWEAVNREGYRLNIIDELNLRLLYKNHSFFYKNNKKYLIKFSSNDVVSYNSISYSDIAGIQKNITDLFFVENLSFSSFGVINSGATILRDATGLIPKLLVQVKNQKKIEAKDISTGKIIQQQFDIISDKISTFIDYGTLKFDICTNADFLYAKNIFEFFINEELGGIYFE